MACFRLCFNYFDGHHWRDYPSHTIRVIDGEVGASHRDHSTPNRRKVGG